jgi:putative phage-type endonuclease
MNNIITANNNITNEDDIKKNIINNIIKHKLNKFCFNILKIDDIIELIESSLYLFTSYIQDNSLTIMYPLFNIEIRKYVHEILIIQLSFLFGNNLCENEKNNINDELNIIIDIASSIFYTYIVPKRSYDKTFIRVQANIPYLRKKISYLQNIEQPEQRTQEWYEFRHNILTASNIYKAFGSESMKNQLIYEKCKPIDPTKYNNVSINSPLHWGVKYEDVSIQYYEYIYKTKISDFGCIKHDIYDFIAASPDGINTLETSLLYGRMLEIKNIVNRIIDGNPKHEYWVQMQLQMEVCKLNECDFLETRFVEYESYEEFIMDGSYTKTNNDKYKGLILYYIKDNRPYYEYAPFNGTEKEHSLWEEENMEKNKNLTWMKNIYWKLEEVSCILVLRNKYWFKNALPYIYNIWDTIKIDRQGDYQHRAPKKMNKRSRINEQDKILKTNNKWDENIKIVHTDMDVDNLMKNVCHINPDKDDKKILNINTETYKKK